MNQQAAMEEFTDAMMTAFAGLEESEMQVGLEGVRQIVRAGGPVFPEEIAHGLDIPVTEVDEILRRWADSGFVFFDEEGRVAAMWGLGGPESGHRFEVEGQAPAYLVRP